MAQRHSKRDCWLWPRRSRLLPAATADKSDFRAVIPNMAASKAHDADKITHVQELLDKEIERIRDLKSLLATAEQHAEQLKQELAGYQTAVTHAIAPTPIKDCPPEILSIIFRLAIQKHAEPQRMGCLLLVCKQWHNLIINDPNMWNCVSIVSPDRWDMLSWARSTHSYLELCAERSRATRLNIQLDFSLLQATKQQLMERLYVGFFHLSSAVERAEDSGLLDEWLDSLDYYGLEEGECSTINNCLPDHAIHLIRVLTDPEVIQRWESLMITFPAAIHLVGEIWEEISPYTINLSRLHILQLEWEDLHELYDDEDDEDLLIPRWSVPQVEELEIGSLIGWDRCLFFDPSSLRRLTVNMSFEEEFFSELARFSQLRTLTLFHGPLSDAKRMDPTLLYRISLPRLQELVLSGEFCDLHTVKWELPNLNCLRVDSGLRVYLQPAMPIVQPSEVHWAAESGPYYRHDTLKTAIKIIRGFFLFYTNSDCFSVTSFLKEAVLKVLKELSNEGVLTPRWKTVSFYDTTDNVETMYIDDILSS